MLLNIRNTVLLFIPRFNVAKRLSSSSEKAPRNAEPRASWVTVPSHLTHPLDCCSTHTLIQHQQKPNLITESARSQVSLAPEQHARPVAKVIMSSQQTSPPGYIIMVTHQTEQTLLQSPIVSLYTTPNRLKK